MRPRATPAFELRDQPLLRLAVLLLIAHLGALVFGLAGMLIAVPNTRWWADDPRAWDVYNFGMKYGGSTHIILGAAAVFAWGVHALGLRKTGTFFAISVPLSLGSELIGTGTGWPFGNYAYTNFLGYKVLDHVPYSIPLSWFYVGFVSYLIGDLIAANLGLRNRTAWGLALGAWFLTVWDLVLDPAMAHETLPIKFWEWGETGPYFGMPVQNFVGWTATALLFMAISRALWRRDPDAPAVRASVWFPLTVYAANTVFAMTLSASVDLWAPILLAAALGIAPSLLAWRGRPRTGEGVPVASAGAWTPSPSQ